MNAGEWLDAAAAYRREKLFEQADADYARLVRERDFVWQSLEIRALDETLDCPALELLPEEAA